MIDRQHGRIIIECDWCDEIVESDKGETFKDFWERLKRDGWVAKFMGKKDREGKDIYNHQCPAENAS